MIGMDNTEPGLNWLELTWTEFKLLKIDYT